MPVLRKPCLGRVSLPPASGDGDWHNLSWYFPAFVLWRLSLVICCTSSESLSSSGRNSASVTEQRDCGPFSIDVLATLTLFLLVLLNPAASWDVRPTLGIPALTPRAGASVYFVFLTPPAASRPARAPGTPGLSLDPVSTPEFRSSVRCLVARPPGSRSQSAVSRVRVHGLPAPRCRWPSSRQPPAAPCTLLELPVSVWIQ